MNSGTSEALVIEITDKQALNHWQTVDDHRPRGGLCPTCRRRSPCPPRAAAVSALILAGRFREPRPIGPDR